jgi:hypothetical protein
MADSKITGGSVRLLERMKTGEYEHREASVELTFGVFEDRDYRDLLDLAHEGCVLKVNQMLGRKDTIESRRAAKTESRRPPRIEVEVASENTNVDAALVVAAAKTELPANKAAVTTSDPEAEAMVPILAKAADPLDMGGAAEDAPSAPTTPSVNLLDMDEGLTAAAPEITDKMLNEQVQHHNNRMIELYRKANGDDGGLGTLKIRELIGKFVPVGKKVKDIPEDQRQNFLDGLRALKCDK